MNDQLLGGLFLADLIPGQRERFERAVQLDVIREGRAAYRAGLSYDRVPPFKDQNMQIAWTCGWRWEKDEQEARKAKGT